MSKASRLAAEPAADDADGCRIVVKLADGTRLDRRFHKGEPLQSVLDYVEASSPDLYDGAPFDLVSNFPRKVFERHCAATALHELGLHPQAMLFTKEADDE